MYYRQHYIAYPVPNSPAQTQPSIPSTQQPSPNTAQYTQYPTAQTLMSAPERSSLAVMYSSRSRSAARVIFLVWIWNILLRVFSSGSGNSIFLSMRPAHDMYRDQMYMYCRGCVVLLCFVVCMALLASFFLPSASLINMYIQYASKKVTIPSKLNAV